MIITVLAAPKGSLMCRVRSPAFPSYPLALQLSSSSTMFLLRRLMTNAIQKFQNTRTPVPPLY